MEKEIVRTSEKERRGKLGEPYESGLVSVIVPTYNRPALLTEALNSVAEQTYRPLQLIVVDDGSDEAPQQAVEQWDRRRGKDDPALSTLLVRQENRGGSAARNTGLARARGEFIQFMDDDDRMGANKLASQVERLRKAPTGVVASSAWQILRGEQVSGSAGMEIKLEEADALRWLLMQLNDGKLTPLHAWLIPRDVAAKAGEWNESLQLNQDGDYIARVLLAASRVVSCRDVCVYYRAHTGDRISRRAGFRSKYEAAQQIVEQILRERDNPHVRSCCADYVQRLAYSAYLKAPGIAEDAEQLAQDLGGSTLNPPGGRLFQWLQGIIGWRRAVRIRRRYRKIRYDSNELAGSILRVGPSTSPK